MDDIDDGLEWEEFLEMSEEQTDALLDRMMKQYNENLRKMNPYQLYCYRRATRLDMCLKQRRLAKTFPEVFEPMRRATQRRLLEARIEYRTGAVSGHS